MFIICVYILSVKNCSYKTKINLYQYVKLVVCCCCKF